MDVWWCTRRVCEFVYLCVVPCGLRVRHVPCVVPCVDVKPASSPLDSEPRCVCVIPFPLLVVSVIAVDE